MTLFGCIALRCHDGIAILLRRKIDRYKCGSFVMNHGCHRVVFVIFTFAALLNPFSYAAQRGDNGYVSLAYEDSRGKNEEKSDEDRCKGWGEISKKSFTVGVPIVARVRGIPERDNLIFCFSSVKNSLYGIVECEKGLVDEYMHYEGGSFDNALVALGMPTQLDRAELAKAIGLQLATKLPTYFVQENSPGTLSRVFTDIWREMLPVNPANNKVMATIAHVNVQTKTLTMMGVGRYVLGYLCRGRDDDSVEQFNVRFPQCCFHAFAKRSAGGIGLVDVALGDGKKKIVLTNNTWGRPLSHEVIIHTIKRLSPTEESVKHAVKLIKKYHTTRFLNDGGVQSMMNVPDDLIEATIPESAMIVIPLNQE